MAIKPGLGKKSSKNPPILSHEFVIQNHADIVSCIAMIFVIGLMLQATSPIASVFVALHRSTTGADPTHENPSLYQGEEFNIMKRDVRTVELKTIEEYKRNEFTFYIYKYMSYRLEVTKLMERHKIINNSERETYNMKTLDSSFKGVVLNYLMPVLYEMRQEKRMKLRICPEVLNSNSFTFFLPKNFYLVDEFNELIDRLESAGISKFIIRKYADSDLMKIREKSTPSVIDYSQAEGVFMLFYCGCVLATVSFLCEALLPFIENLTCKTLVLRTRV